jgi:REP element-mobilizing transposase RayT
MSDQVNFIQVDRYWFLTSTTYGTWLPGDERGFVGSLLDDAGQIIDHNQVGTPPTKPNQNLRQSAVQRLKSAPIILTLAQAEELFEQFEETAQIRGWLLIAVGVMHTHVHMVIGVVEDPDPDKILRDFKAYGSGKLNQKWGKPPSVTWWTSGGSTRKLEDDRAIETVVQYIRKQPNPLLIWTRGEGRIL